MAKAGDKASSRSRASGAGRRRQAAAAGDNGRTPIGTGLPIVEASAALDDALKAMHRAKVSAVLVKKNRAFQAFSIWKVAAARQKGLATLAEMRPDLVLHLNPSPGAASEADSPAKAAPPGTGPEALTMRYVAIHSEGQGLPLPGAGAPLWRAYESDPNNSPTPIGGHHLATAASIRSFRLTAAFVAPPRDFYCTGPVPHGDFPPPPVKVDDPCPYCTFPIVSSV